MYKLPQPTSNAPYKIYITGDTITNTVEANLMMTASGFAVGMENLMLNPGHDLLMTITPDGLQVTFNASEEGTFSPDVYYAVDPDPNGDSYIFNVGGFNLSSFKTITTTLNLTQKTLHFEDDDGVADTYEIEVTRIKADGTEQSYVNNDVALDNDGQGDMNFGAWDGENAMPMTIDGQVNTLPNKEIELKTAVTGQGEVFVSEDAPYLPNQTISLFAEAASGWVFSHWADGASGNTNPLSITLNSTKNITSVFVQAPVGRKVYLPIVLHK